MKQILLENEGRRQTPRKACLKLIFGKDATRHADIDKFTENPDIHPGGLWWTVLKGGFSILISRFRC